MRVVFHELDVDDVAGLAVTFGQRIDRFQSRQITNPGVTAIDDHVIRILVGFALLGILAHRAKV